MTVIAMHFLNILFGLTYLGLVLAAPVAPASNDILIGSEEDVHQPGGML